VSEKLFPGTVVQVGDDGVARRVPWYESDTTYGDTGSGRTRIRKRVHQPAFLKPDPITPRDDRSRAEALAEVFVKQLRAMESNLGRPLEPADLSEEWLRTFGLQFWRTGDPVTTEDMRKVAEFYLEAARKGVDANYAPAPIK
jgi:hypothetical protein